MLDRTTSGVRQTSSSLQFCLPCSQTRWWSMRLEGLQDVCIELTNVKKTGDLDYLDEIVCVQTCTK